MKVLTLDARQWQTADDVFEALLDALGAPDWHSRNLDALNDSLRGGDLNAINPPLTIQVAGLDGASAVARITAWRVRHLCIELANDGIPIAWSSFVHEPTDNALRAFEEFRAAALQKDRDIEAGVTSQDAALHATMAARLRQLFELDTVGTDCIEALLHDRPQVASWIAAELAARGDQRGSNVLQALAQLPGLPGFSARMALRNSGRASCARRLGCEQQVLCASVPQCVVGT